MKRWFEKHGHNLAGLLVPVVFGIAFSIAGCHVSKSLREHDAGYIEMLTGGGQ